MYYCKIAAHKNSATKKRPPKKSKRFFGGRFLLASTFRSVCYCVFNLQQFDFINLNNGVIVGSDREFLNTGNISDLPIDKAVLVGSLFVPYY